MQSTAIVQLESVPVDQPKSTQHQQQPEEAVESVDQPVQEAREQSTTNVQQEPGTQQPRAEAVVSLKLRTVANVRVKWADQVDKPLFEVRMFVIDRSHLPLKKRPLKKVNRKSKTVRPRQPTEKRIHAYEIEKSRVPKAEPQWKTYWTYDDNYPEEPDNDLR